VKTCPRFGIVVAVALPLLLSGCATSSAPIKITIAREDVLDDYVKNRAQRPVVIVDLDDTVVDGGTLNSVALFLSAGQEDTRPFLRAPTSLQIVENNGWSVIFLTARPKLLQKQTLAWLDLHGFLETPVIFSPTILLSAQAKEDFKASAIANLRRHGLRIEAGVGDKASDMGAYLRNDLRMAFIAENAEDPDIADVTERLGSGRKPDLREIGWDGAWPAIAGWLGKPSAE
jgi:hypothetical protein